VTPRPVRNSVKIAARHSSGSSGIPASGQSPDEVGVGAFAGSVVAAAVILAPDQVIDGLADSKLLSPKRREKLFAVISAGAVAIGIGRADVEEVDRLNIYWAAMEARRRAVEALPWLTGSAGSSGCRVPQTAVVDGDALSVSIAAASIVAKVTRDSIMQEYAQFERHKRLRHDGSYLCSRTARAVAASSLVIRASVACSSATIAACIVGTVGAVKCQLSRPLRVSPLRTASNRSARLNGLANTAIELVCCVIASVASSRCAVIKINGRQEPDRTLVLWMVVHSSI
jgi:ribonuclease HII